MNNDEDDDTDCDEQNFELIEVFPLSSCQHGAVESRYTLQKNLNLLKCFIVST